MDNFQHKFVIGHWLLVIFNPRWSPSMLG